MQAEYELSLPPVEASLIRCLSSLCERVFGEPVPDIDWRMCVMPKASAFCAYMGDELVGFKLGYAMSQTKYYSWLGGVLPSVRRIGVGTKLMELQHSWLIEGGYTVVETSANQENVSMAQLNLKSGFRICGLRIEPRRVQVLYAKQLR